jgi:hypothetical protein
VRRSLRRVPPVHRPDWPWSGLVVARPRLVPFVARQLPAGQLIGAWHSSCGGRQTRLPQLQFSRHSTGAPGEHKANRQRVARWPCPIARSRACRVFLLTFRLAASSRTEGGTPPEGRNAPEVSGPGLRHPFGHGPISCPWPGPGPTWRGRAWTSCSSRPW